MFFGNVNDAGGAGGAFAGEEKGVEGDGSDARDEGGLGSGVDEADGGALLCRDHYCHFDMTT